MIAKPRKCRISYPTVRTFERAVEKLRREYPEDSIDWKGGGREQVMQAIAAARWAFQLSRGKLCYARKIAAGADLFYEVAMLHPLIDGNKRLAVVMLAGFLVMNRLPRPRPGSLYRAVLRVVGGEWSQEDVYRWLLRVYRAKRKKRGG